MIKLVSIKYLVRNWTWKRPKIYYAFQYFNGGLIRHDKSLTVSQTEIVIEGYPRSGNTFVQEAFEYSQSKFVNTAHHFHSPASVLVAVKLNKPVVLLIRKPLDSIVSLLLRHPETPIYWAIKSYEDFYSTLLPVLDKVVVAEFGVVSTNLGSIFQEVNEKFLVDFSIFEHNEKNQKACFNRIDIRNAKRLGSKVSNFLQVARPSKERSILKSDVIKKLDSELFKQQLIKAEKIYNLYKSTLDS